MPDDAPDPQWGWRERQILSARQAAAIAGHGVTHRVGVWLAWLRGRPNAIDELDREVGEREALSNQRKRRRSQQGW